MSTYILRNPSGEPIWDDSYYKVVSQPEGNIVEEGQCSGEVALSLDPGKYLYLVSKCIDKTSTPNVYTGFRGEFYHEVDEHNWKRISGTRPKYAQTMQVSTGVRHTCGFSGCSFSTHSRYAIIKHEADHQGVDIFTQKGLVAYKTSEVKQKATKAVKDTVAVA